MAEFRLEDKGTWVDDRYGSRQYTAFWFTTDRDEIERRYRDEYDLLTGVLGHISERADKSEPDLWLRATERDGLEGFTLWVAVDVLERFRMNQALDMVETLKGRICNEVIVKEVAARTAIPALLTDAQEVADRRWLLPDEFIQLQKEADRATDGNFYWVEDCIRGIGGSDWLVMDSTGKEIGAITTHFNGSHQTYTISIDCTLYTFNTRALAIAATLAFKGV